MRALALLMAFTLCTMVSQVLLKSGLREAGDLSQVTNPGAMVLVALKSHLILAGVGIQAVGFLLWLMVLSKVKLGVAFAVAGGLNYLALGVLSGVVFREPLSPWDWLGLGLVLAGVVTMTLKSIVLV